MIKIMLDCSPAKIRAYSERYNHDFWQLRTPLTKYALSGKPYGLDNGCFTEFRERIWRRLVREARIAAPMFVTLPDVVGDAQSTVALFRKYRCLTVGLPRALVLQDGISGERIPWDELAAVFVGGSDDFKVSAECIDACREAKRRGKWVHVGRVNTVERLRNWTTLGDSLDGSGLSRYDHMLERVLKYLGENFNGRRDF